jgi:hypothetical protein
MKRKYNYQVIFKGKLSEGSSKFMNETMARTFAMHILSHSKLDDMVVQVRRLTPEPIKWDYTIQNSTAADLGNASFTTDADI